MVSFVILLIAISCSWAISLKSIFIIFILSFHFDSLCWYSWSDNTILMDHRRQIKPPLIFLTVTKDAYRCWFAPRYLGRLSYSIIQVTWRSSQASSRDGCFREMLTHANIKKTWKCLCNHNMGAWVLSYIVRVCVCVEFVCNKCNNLTELEGVGGGG